MENARVYFAKEFMPDDVRRMYLILKKGLPGGGGDGVWLPGV